MTHWQVSAIGAFDRFNYGDVLFAKVAEHMLSQHFPDADVAFYALRAADLQGEGGVVTEPLSALYRKQTPPDRRHLVMLCGGELLAPTWAQMAEHLVGHNFSLQMKRLHSKTGHSNWTWFWRRFYGCSNLQPWTIDPDDMKDPDRVSVVYNAVGGTSTSALSPQELAWQTRALRKAAWISIRDEIVAGAVVERGLPTPRVVPDSAVVMAALLSEAETLAARQKAVEIAGLSSAPYLCFQAAERWARGHEDELVDALRRVHDETGLNVLSFAIGRAAGHDDHVTSLRLLDRLSGEDWFGIVDQPLTVNETMGLIAGSQCYVGTSLHGFITAFAFGRPRVGLMPHLEKLIGFRDAWDLAEMPAGMEFSQIPDGVKTAMSLDSGLQSQKAATADQAYRQSFAEMISVLQR
ncbi:polysaccharide pyruvyl transferase family protein [Tropicimonas sp. TH_r6]|uniref:polysaccharide pyruvyl transferase family protein n=1 Tax=Tropicimonas sp. TH_r6 TaxID=3082085 RepID=UPI002952A1C4|nr:polysaccharide pyruvyl transferase family protein [Tropicimonas sp. TH_r6]MDV7141990.1 polysaccharide pyruvyl transferase family protein [Tropicimonas sp. TH_r6]